jgi:single-strand DNA-binding protein
MASINKAILIGNVGRAPEHRVTPNGTSMTTISLATSDRYKDKQTGDIKESTEWHRVVFWGKLAEIANQLIRSGSQIYVEGRITTQKYQKEGVDHFSTSINAEMLQVLGKKPTDSEYPPFTPKPINPTTEEGGDDDIPFW